MALVVDDLVDIELDGRLFHGQRGDSGPEAGGEGFRVGQDGLGAPGAVQGQ